MPLAKLPSICSSQCVHNPYRLNIGMNAVLKTELTQNGGIDRRASFNFLFALTVVTWSTSSFSEELIDVSEDVEKRGSQRGVYIDVQDFPYFTGR